MDDTPDLLGLIETLENRSPLGLELFFREIKELFMLLILHISNWHVSYDFWGFVIVRR